MSVAWPVCFSGWFDAIAVVRQPARQRLELNGLPEEQLADYPCHHPDYQEGRPREALRSDPNSLGHSLYDQTGQTP